MSQFTSVTSRVVSLPVNDVDTDQIIPARFLKVTDRLGLGDNLFYDWRFSADGSPRPEFVLNKPESRGAKILLAGDNFGCGSSREHAPWALLGFGFKIVISTSFADIFNNNSLKNGLLPVVVNPSVHQSLNEMLRKDPQSLLTVDLASQAVTFPDGRSVSFPVDGFSKHCLLNGIDELGYLLSFEESISSYERSKEGGTEA